MGEDAVVADLTRANKLFDHILYQSELRLSHQFAVLDLLLHRKHFGVDLFGWVDEV